MMIYLLDLCRALASARDSAYTDVARQRLDDAQASLLRVCALLYGATLEEVGGEING